MRTITCLALVTVCVAAGLLMFGLHQRAIPTYQDANVQAGEFVSPFNSIFVHARRKTYLKVGQVNYVDVRGMKPYYLNVPDIQSILFVTEAFGHVKFHVHNLQTGSDIEIDGDSSGFGGAIGSHRTPGERGTDYIEEVSSNRITLVKKSFRWKDVTVLNLASKQMERVQCFYYDREGNITNSLITFPK